MIRIEPSLSLGACPMCGSTQPIEPAPKKDAHTNLRAHMRAFCNGSRVRYIPCGPTVPTS